MKSIAVQFPLKKRISSLVKARKSEATRYLLWCAIKGLCLGVICSFTLTPTYVKAQIKPDETVNTQTQQEGNNVDITGGTREGNNLFHSFEEFSIPTGEEASFNNDADIENIFTRVTGEGISNIDGILRAQGSANLFLLNPNGIIFGENATLDVGGSFVGTTANSIEFADGNSFSASDVNTKPVLTVSVPVGLGFMGNSPGPILVNGGGSQISRQPDIAQFSPFDRGNGLTGLYVQPEKTLALVGGEVNVEGGKLSAQSGQIELGSVGSGEVKLNPTQSGFSLDYEAVSNFKDVNLSEKASADSSGNGGGSVGVYGANVRLTDGSVFLIQNNGNTPSGNINVNATQSLILSGAASDRSVSSITSETLNDGSAANIKVSAKELLLQNGGNITSTTFGFGKGGNIDVNAFDSVRLFRTPDKFIERASSRIAAPTYGVGDAGTISISTPLLKASNGSSIATGGALSSGNSGSVNIKADSIELDGLTEKDGLFTTIISTAFGTGNAGRLNIDTSTLKLMNGATVSTDSRNVGTAGNVTINASERVEVSGVDSNTLTPSAVSSSVTLEGNEVFRQSLRLPSIPSGKAGDVTINTPLVKVNSGGEVSVKNQGTGEAGKLEIKADSLLLDDGGKITAETASGNGGNINISADRLSVDNESKVTATAANNGNGGNINIKTILLEAKKNSDITANAFAGKGGNITLDTKILLRSPDSDITASSERGISGTVNFINNPEEIEKFLLLELPGFMDTNKLIADSCLDPNRKKLEFANKRGGVMPVNPDSSVDLDIEGNEPIPTVQSNTGSYVTTDSTGETVIYPSDNESSWQPGEPVIEANDIVQTNDGRILGVRKMQPEEAQSLICH